ncbi:hypothetical protein AAG906_008507 [Vitis piasezkii]
MCGMRYRKHTSMSRMLPKSSNSRRSSARWSNEIGRHEYYIEIFGFVARTRSQLRRGMRVHE